MWNREAEKRTEDDGDGGGHAIAFMIERRDTERQRDSARGRIRLLVISSSCRKESLIQIGIGGLSDMAARPVLQRCAATFGEINKKRLKCCNSHRLQRAGSNWQRVSQL